MFADDDFSSLAREVKKTAVQKMLRSEMPARSQPANWNAAGGGAPNDVSYEMYLPGNAPANAAALYQRRKPAVSAWPSAQVTPPRTSAPRLADAASTTHAPAHVLHMPLAVHQQTPPQSPLRAALSPASNRNSQRAPQRSRSSAVVPPPPPPPPAALTASRTVRASSPAASFARNREQSGSAPAPVHTEQSHERETAAQQSHSSNNNNNARHSSAHVAATSGDATRSASPAPSIRLDTPSGANRVASASPPSPLPADAKPRRPPLWSTLPRRTRRILKHVLAGVVTAAVLFTMLMLINPSFVQTTSLGAVRDASAAQTLPPDAGKALLWAGIGGALAATLPFLWPVIKPGIEPYMPWRVGN